MPKMIRLCYTAAVAAGLMITLISACATGKPEEATAKNPYFSVLSAQSEEFSAGRRGGERGTEYTLRVKIVSTKKIQFDSLWVGKKALTVYPARLRGPVSSAPVTFKKGDTIFLKATGPLESELPVTGRTPVAYKGSALVSYRVGGKRYYQVVSQFTRQNNPPRPQ